MTFKDYFSKQASDYARYRPHYPESLFEYLASLVSEPETVWDCGTGNGQAALGLTPYFGKVVATDASANQIAQAFAHEKIGYSVAPAEQTDLASQSIDLVTVGTAVHWFNFDLFYPEVKRVLKPHGVIAVWSYGEFEMPSITAELWRIIQAFKQLVQPFRPEEHKLIKEKYQTIPFPFAELESPTFSMTAEWTAEDLIGYTTTWSITQRLFETYGLEPFTTFAQQVTDGWNAAQATELVQWPIYLRVGKLA